MEAKNNNKNGMNVIRWWSDATSLVLGTRTQISFISIRVI